MGKATEHLSISELESIAQGLFIVKSKSGSELTGLCPVHDDKNPSFSYNTSKDVCYCQACGFTTDIIGLYTKVKGFGDAKEGFKAFCQEYNISDGFTPPQGKKEKKKELPNLDDAYQMLGPLPDSWKIKLEKTRGWTSSAMDLLGLRQQTHYQAKKTGKILPIKKPDRIAIPIFDDDGHVINIRLYKPGGRQ